MKIEEHNQHISTSPVATEATYMHYEAMGIFGKRNISLVLMYSPHILIWYSFLSLILEKQLFGSFSTTYFRMYKTSKGLC